MATSTTNQVQALYIGYFGRAADPSGLSFWVSAVNNGTITLENLGTAFAASAEYQGLYGSLTNAQLVSAIYTNVLNRAADNDGLNFWVSELQKGTATPNNLVAKMLNSMGAADQLNMDNRVASANTYTTSVTDATYSNSDATIAAGIGGTSENPSLVLTTAQDKYTGTNGNDVIRGVAGVGVGGQDQTTLNSSDILDGGAGNDLLAVNMTGTTYAGGATIKNIETLQIGTNLTAPVTFDYNVNNGAYEVTGVNKVIYDQITNGESLAVNNITPTSTTNGIPTLSWENESGSRAGTVTATYREASTTGTSTNQAINLKNVSATNAGDGVLNIGAGVETITLNSTGTIANNTLSNSTNTDSGVYSAAADLVSNGSLTKVVLTGDVAIGKVGGVVTTTTNAQYGKTDRAAGSDLGLTADTGTNTVNATKSNLLSVDARVTTVDASAMTAAANVRFVAKTDGTATNVTFLGGSAGDYAEFELGNVTANGGAGNDTFAFITNAAGITNSTYGAGDTITGGTGTDTLQLGVNGIGTYNVSTTEFSNTTGIDALDLRGATNTVTLASTLVSGADAGKFEVHTDRIIQSSSTSALNPTGVTTNNALEDASVNTINLTDLTTSQGIKFVGGSGSDRLVLDDASFNQNMVLDGGTRETATIAAGTAKYDTLTVVDSAILDRTDLANVSNFEGLVLTETGTGNSNFSIELTAAFLAANTLAANDANTGINDTIFQIGTANAANANTLEAGDTVTIDISGLLNSTRTAKDATITTRSIDVSSLTNAGVTVNYVVDGAAATAAQIALVLGTDALAADVINSAANVTAAAATTGNTLIATGAGFNTTSGFLLNGGVATALNDTLNSTAANLVGSTVNLAGGTDVVNVTTAVTGVEAAGVGVALGAGTGVETINFQQGTTANTTVQATTVNLSAAGIVTLGAAGTLNGSTGADSLTGSAGNDTITNGGGTGVDTITAGTGNDTITLTGSGNTTVDAGAGNDTINASASTGAVSVIGGAGQDSITLNATNGVADRISFSDGTAGILTRGILSNADADTITGFNAANDIIALDSDQTTVLTAAGATPVLQVVNAAAATTLSNTADLTVFNFDQGGTTSVLAGVTDGSALLANTGALTYTAAADSGYILAYDNGNAYLYSYTDAAAGGAALAGEIQLIGTINGAAVGSLGVANFALQA